MENIDQILQEKRYRTDAEADYLVNRLLSTNRANFLYETLSTSLDRLPGFRSGDPGIHAFLQHKPEVPDWLDQDQLKQASDFYISYALEIMMLLGAVSLPSCYAASPGNKVLYISEKIRKKPGKRLLETAAFVIAISEPGAFKPGGISYYAVQKVRLIHALARYHILSGGNWDHRWGLPLNEEDMIGTNLAFSYTVLAALKSSGFKLQEKDLNAYLHLWKWVGYLMKIEETLLTDRMEEAKCLDQVIRARNFKKSPEGISLIRSLIDHYQEALPWGLGLFVESQIKYFTGPEVAEILDLKSDPIRDRMVYSLSFIRKFMNSWLPHRPSYEKMRKDHERLRGIYLE